jgi:hypothetical protein
MQTMAKRIQSQVSDNVAIPQTALLAALAQLIAANGGTGGGFPVGSIPQANETDDNETDDGVPSDVALATARQQTAGGFTLRKSKGGGGGEYVASAKPNAKGLAGVAEFDSTTRKVSIPVKQRDGSIKREVKTAHLTDDTRNVVGPLLAESFRTVNDNGDRKVQSVRLAMLDSDGNAIRGSEMSLALCTSAAGSLMLTGDVSIPLDVADKHGKRTVTFSATLWAIARQCHRRTS